MKLNILFLLLSSYCFSQNSLQIRNLKPDFDESKFPEILYKGNPKVAEKINTFLQLEQLEHLPGIYKKHPFEKVAYDGENCCSSVAFYAWEKYKTPKNIVSFTMEGVATGAYPEEFKIYKNFDLQTGNPILIKEIFTPKGLLAVNKMLNQKVKKEITDYLFQAEKDSKSATLNDEEKQYFSEQLSMYEECLEGIENNTMDYYSFYFSGDSIIFSRGRCSNHARRALDDLDVFLNGFHLSEIKKHLSAYGISLIEGKDFQFKSKALDWKMYKGKINSKYPITALISEIYDRGMLNMKYWYDRVKTPIDLQGYVRDGNFEMTELQYQESSQTLLPMAQLQGKYSDGKLIGTWTNAETNEVLKFELEVY